MPAESSEKPLPTEELGAPARRALARAGYTTLGQLAESSEANVGGLHGVGPGALGTPREALDAHDLSFADGG